MTQEAMAAAPQSRSARKRRAILDVATELFLREGYQGTSMDQVAAQAAVSKQTVYKNFGGKERLFAAILQGLTDRVSEFLDAATASLRQADDLEGELRLLARRYLATVLQPEVLQLRRLVVAEAGRLPELAQAYYESAQERTIAAFAACFRELADRGLLRLDDPRLAASHFAFLIVGQPLDRAMFHVADADLSEGDLDRLAEAGVRAFLAAYGNP